MPQIIYKSVGFQDSYPHSDFESPCTCPECCMDEEHGYVPRCEVCQSPIKRCGLCVDCVNTKEGQEYMSCH